MNEVARIVEEAISDVLQRRGRLAPVNGGDRLQDDLQLSSLNLISIITDACEALGIDLTALSDVELATVRTVADLIALLEATAPCG